MPTEASVVASVTKGVGDEYMYGNETKTFTRLSICIRFINGVVTNSPRSNDMQVRSGGMLLTPSQSKHDLVSSARNYLFGYFRVKKGKFCFNKV